MKAPVNYVIENISGCSDLCVCSVPLQCANIGIQEVTVLTPRFDLNKRRM